MKWIVGIDEVGRGPLAGPVYVCAYAMPEKIYIKMCWVKNGVELTDSKLLSPKNREYWNTELQSMIKKGIAKVVIAKSTVAAIDKNGIAICIRDCVSKALGKLELKPTDCTVLLDGGLAAPALYKNQRTVIKGDRIHKAIAAAAVIAKVARDAFMVRTHRSYPVYGWDANKGYGTAAHGRAIKAHGLTPLHRRSFTKRYLTK